MNKKLFVKVNIDSIHTKRGIVACRLFLVLFISLLFLLLSSGCSTLDKNSETSVLSTDVVDSKNEIDSLQEQLRIANEEANTNTLKIRELNNKISSLTQQVDELTLLNMDLEEQINLQKDAQPNGHELFTAVLSCEQITFNTTETDYIVIGRMFMDMFGEHLLAVSAYFPSDEYAVDDYMIIDVSTISEAVSAQPVPVEDGVIFTVSSTYAIKPLIPLNENSPLWAGNTTEYAEKEGWYKMSRVLKLKLDNNGNVSLVSIGTGL